MGVVTRLASGRLKNEGVEVKALLRKAGLTEQQIDDPCSRVAVKDRSPNEWAVLLRARFL